MLFCNVILGLQELASVQSQCPVTTKSLIISPSSVHGHSVKWPQVPLEKAWRKTDGINFGSVAGLSSGRPFIPRALGL